MRNGTRGARQGWTDRVHVRFHLLRELLGESGRRVWARSRGMNVDEACSIPARWTASSALRALALFLGLFAMLGCAGGWQGSRRYAPSITLQPANQTVAAGISATFTVGATGTAPLSYQWYRGGTLIGGATSSTYTTPAAQSSDDGSTFYVVISNAAGAVLSRQASLTVTTAALQSIAVTPTSSTIAAGATQQFTATGSYSDGSTQNITTSVTWSSATATVATIGASTGLATGMSMGTSQITATKGGIASSAIALTVTSATLQSIAVTPGSASIAKGLTQRFTATGTFSDGSTQNITITVGWSSATPSVATISPRTGVGTGVGTGTAQITATKGGIVSAPATLTVTAPVLQSIVVTPASASIAKGLTQQFIATGTYSDGSTQNITAGATWASGAVSAATIGASTGLATGVGAGTSLITATQGSTVSPPATLTVTAAALQSISVTPAGPSITVGATQQFTATGSYTDGSTTNITTSVTWASGTTSVATIGSNTGMATGLAAGTSQITAIQGSVVSPAETLTVINSTPVATSLVCSPENPPYNSAVTLVPTFSGGTGAIGSTGTFSFDITGSAVSGDSYTTPPVTAAMTYTLTVTGSGGTPTYKGVRPLGVLFGGNIATTTCSVTPTSVSIASISPANQTMAPGQLSFTAVVSGGATNTVTWSASGGSFSGNNWTAPNTAGSYTITATSVDDPSTSLSTGAIVSLPAITGQPVSQNVCPGNPVTLSVSASYASSYQWKLGGAAILGASSSSYEIPGAVSGDAGTYTVTITNAAGNVTSNVARLVVGSSITSNPQSLSIYATQTATFSVSADGQSPFSYQWYEIAPGDSTGTVITGATSSTYTTPAVNAGYDGAKYYATVTDICGGSALTSTEATLTVTSGNVPPTITTEPAGQTVAVGGTTTFSVVASGTPSLSYQWYEVPSGSVSGIEIFGATTASYTVPSTDTTASNDQDAYYVIVSNPYGQAVSEHAPLAVGNGILLQITDQPKTVYVNEGASATFRVTASSSLPLTYQWKKAPAGSSSFVAITGATSSTYTVDTTASTDTGTVFQVVVSNGSTSSVTSNTAALFVGALSGVNDLCDENWNAVGDAVALGGCSFQLTAAGMGQHGEIVWPTLISTGNIQLSFTVAISNPSSPPEDGFAMVLGDPSLGATTSTTGATGQGLGAEGIPGFVLGFDTYLNAGDPEVPYLGVGRGESALWENPWLNVNTNIPALASLGITVSHNYIVSIVQGKMTVSMDGTQVFSGNVTVPPVAYLYVTASTGGSYEKTVISNLAATVSAPSN